MRCTTRRRPMAVLIGWTILTVLGAAWWIAPQASAAGTGEGIVDRGELPFTVPGAGALGFDSKARLFYVVAADNPDPGTVTVRRADAPYDQVGQPITIPPAAGLAVAVDEVHHRLFVAITPPAPLLAADANKNPAARLM